MRIFVAGATGATGSVFVPLATRRGHDLRLHVRPSTAQSHPLGQDPRSAVFDLADSRSLEAALDGVDLVLSLVGTMRSRFGAGDTYESSDVGSTRQLVAAVSKRRVPRMLLLSSVGAGGLGAYLKMKGECERIVRDAPDLRWTIFRPAALQSPPGSSGHLGAREVPGAMVMLGQAFRALPGMAGVADDYRPIPLEVLSRAMLSVIEAPRDGEILTGRELWPLGAA